MDKAFTASDFDLSCMGKDGDNYTFVLSNEERLAVMSALQSQCWRPIETPNNEQSVFGRDVLLLYPDGNVIRCYSDGRHWKVHGTTKLAERGYTHFIVLPAPPEKGEVKL